MGRSSAVPPGSTAPVSHAVTERQDSRSPAVEKGRAAVTSPNPAVRPPGLELESSNTDLSAALRLASAAPSPENLRRVAEAYRKAGVLDQAHEYFTRALRIDPTDGWAHDGRARIWRDWGAPGLGLGDAYRAVYYLPDAPEALNTLGTLLYALGHHADARARFEQVLQREPDAVYGLTNLCYAALTEGDSRVAVAACRRAVSLVPDLSAARNNLALVYAAQGDMSAATRELAAANDPARLQYNLGVISLASRRYEEAAAAFEAAARLRPSLPHVAERARQARALAGGSDVRR